MKLPLVGGPPTDKFGVLFTELLALVVLAPFSSSSRLLRLVTFALAVAIVLTTMRSVGAGLPGFRMMLVVGVAAVAIITWASVTTVSSGIAFSIAAIGCVVGIGPPLLVRRIFQRREFEFADVAAALCAYLELGLFFSFLYGALDLLTTNPFFAQGPSTEASDYLYFSFVTMLTLGYGDLTPATDLGRVLVIMETLIGQIFLVVLVAYLVGSMVGGQGGGPDTDQEPSPRDAGNP